MEENRELTQREKEKMHPNYLDVIQHYERVTKRKFTKKEVVILKMLISEATPATVKAMITRFYKQYPDNFVDLEYIYQPVKNMFGHRKGGSN